MFKNQIFGQKSKTKNGQKSKIGYKNPKFGQKSKISTKLNILSFDFWQNLQFFLKKIDSWSKKIISTKPEFGEKGLFWWVNLTGGYLGVKRCKIICAYTWHNPPIIYRTIFSRLFRLFFWWKKYFVSPKFSHQKIK